MNNLTLTHLFIAAFAFSHSFLALSSDWKHTKGIPGDIGIKRGNGKCYTATFTVEKGPRGKGSTGLTSYMTIKRSRRNRIVKGGVTAQVRGFPSTRAAVYDNVGGSVLADRTKLEVQVYSSRKAIEIQIVKPALDFVRSRPRPWGPEVDYIIDVYYCVEKVSRARRRSSKSQLNESKDLYKEISRLEKRIAKTKAGLKADEHYLRDLKRRMRRIRRGIKKENRRRKRRKTAGY